MLRGSVRLGAALFRGAAPFCSSVSSACSASAAGCGSCKPVLNSEFPPEIHARVSPGQYLEPATYAGLRKPVSLATTVIPDAFLSDAFYALEAQQVFSKSWVCVGYTQELPSPGSVLTAEVANQPIIVTKNKKGELNAFYNVCRHRGAKLIKSDGIHEVIRCPYHSWGYSLDGKLLGTPYYNQKDAPPPDMKAAGVDEFFDKKDYGLLPVKVDTFWNLVFVNLDPNAPPLREQYGDLHDLYAHYDLPSTVRYESVPYSVNANWKLVSENFMEYYHLPWVHPELCKTSGMDQHVDYQGRGQYVGFGTTPLAKGGTAMDADFLPPLLDSLSARDRVSAYFVHMFPNVAWFLLPSHFLVLLMKPKGPKLTLETMDVFVNPRIAGEKAKIDELMRFYKTVNDEDVDIVERVQAGVQCKPYPGGRMVFRFEKTIHRFQNILADYMTGVRHIPAAPPKQPYDRS